jgi:integrase
MSVYLNPKTGYYEYSFAVQRRRIHGSPSTKNRREAERAEAEHRETLKKEIKAQQSGTQSLRIDDVAERYWHDVGQYHSGKDGTDRRLGWLCAYFGENKLITDITHDAAAAMVATRRAAIVPNSNPPRQISPTTVNHTIRQLKELIAYCKTRKIQFPTEPNWKELRLKEPEERVRELHADEAERIDATLRDDFAPLFEFARITGKRKTECYTLRWADVHWDTGWIERPGKGQRRVRVKITPSIARVLRPLYGHHEVYVFTYVAQRTSKDKSRIKGRRYPITKNGLDTRWQRTKAKAEITDFRFHDFRHDFATKLLRETGNLKLVSKAIDHANIATTARYAHILDDEVGDAMEKLATKTRGNHPENHPTKALKVV